MKVAIIYTGMVRTMEKTLPFFKQNVNHHVFAVIQSENKEQDLILLQQMGQHLKSYQWFDKQDPEWITLQQHLLNKMTLNSGWKHYIGTESGSMIEYYQMYLAYLNLLQYEIDNHIEYDYIMRLRTDVVITRPIHFFNQNSFDLIDHDKQSILKLMTSILDPNRYQGDVNRYCYPSSMAYQQLIKPHDDWINQFKNYLNQKQYLITMRENLIYYGPREVFTKIHQLGVFYGKFKDHMNPYWFNAESQFRGICAFYDIDIFDSCSELEA